MIEVLQRPFVEMSNEDFVVFCARGFGMHHYVIIGKADRADADRMLFLVANAPHESERQLGLKCAEKEKTNWGSRL